MKIVRKVPMSASAADTAKTPAVEAADAPIEVHAANEQDTTPAQVAQPAPAPAPAPVAPAPAPAAPVAPTPAPAPVAEPVTPVAPIPAAPIAETKTEAPVTTETAPAATAKSAPKKKVKTTISQALAAKKEAVKRSWSEDEVDEDFTKILQESFGDDAKDALEIFKGLLMGRIDGLKNRESFTFCGLKFTKDITPAKFNSFNRGNNIVYYTTAYVAIDAKCNGERTTISAIGDKESKTLKGPFMIKDEKGEWIAYDGDLIKEASDAYPDFCKRSEEVNKKNLDDAQRRLA